jgi:hypothetical protein
LSLILDLSGFFPAMFPRNSGISPESAHFHPKSTFFSTNPLPTWTRAAGHPHTAPGSSSCPLLARVSWTFWLHASIAFKSTSKVRLNTLQKDSLADFLGAHSWVYPRPPGSHLHKWIFDKVPRILVQAELWRSSTLPTSWLAASCPSSLFILKSLAHASNTLPDSPLCLNSPACLSTHQHLEGWAIRWPLLASTPSLWKESNPTTAHPGLRFFGGCSGWAITCLHLNI